MLCSKDLKGPSEHHYWAVLYNLSFDGSLQAFIWRFFRIIHFTVLYNHSFYGSLQAFIWRFFTIIHFYGSLQSFILRFFTSIHLTVFYNHSIFTVLYNHSFCGSLQSFILQFFTIIHFTPDSRCCKILYQWANIKLKGIRHIFIVPISRRSSRLYIYQRPVWNLLFHSLISLGRMRRIFSRCSHSHSINFRSTWYPLLLVG